MITLWSISRALSQENLKKKINNNNYCWKGTYLNNQSGIIFKREQTWRSNSKFLLCSLCLFVQTGKSKSLVLSSSKKEKEITHGSELLVG